MPLLRCQQEDVQEDRRLISPYTSAVAAHGHHAQIAQGGGVVFLGLELISKAAPSDVRVPSLLALTAIRSLALRPARVSLILFRNSTAQADFARIAHQASKASASAYEFVRGSPFYRAPPLGPSP